MKKLFTLVTMLILSLSIVTEAKCYIVGNAEGNSWDPNVGVELQETSSGIYKGDVEITGDGYFGIAENLTTDGNWDYFNQNFRYNAASKDCPVTLGTEMTMTKGGTDMSWKIDLGTYTFTVNFNNNTLLVTSTDGSGNEDPVTPSSETWCLVGGFNSWNITEAPEFTEVSDGVYEITIAELGGQFKIAKDHAWDTNFGSNGTDLTTNTEYSLMFNASGNLQFANETTYTNCKLTFKPTGAETATLYFEGTAKEAVTEFEEIYVIGNMNNWNFTSTEHKLTRESADSKIYKGSIEMIAAAQAEYCYWRIYEQLNQIGSWGLEAEQEVEANITSATLTRGSEVAITTAPGIYDVVFNLDTGALTLTKTGESDDPIVPPTPSDDVWCLVGEFNEWDIENAPEFTMVSEGVYEITMPELGGQFKIAANHNWEDTNYGTNGTDVAATTEYQLVERAENLQFTNGDTFNNCKLTFKKTANGATLYVEVEQVQETVWCLVGGFNNWDIAGAPEFTKVSDGVYEISVAELGGQFKIASNHSWSGVNYGSNGTALTIETDYSLVASTDANISFENENTYTDCKLTLTINAEGASLYATGTLKPVVTEFEELYVIGDMNNWDFSNTDYKLTRESADSKTYVGKLKFTVAAENEYCYWRIYEQLGQIGSWGLAEAQETPSDITSATLVRLSEAAITTLPGEYNVTFNIETGELALSPVNDSVESIENTNNVYVTNGSIVAPNDAEIYSINGTRVNGENVAKGVYIVKTAEKTVKILVK